jgi:hypothetical protein
MARCAGITRAGTACKGIPIDDSEYCYVHHPDHAEERRQHGSKGGRRGGRGRPRGEITNIKTQLQDLADGVLDESVDRANAAVVNQLLNTLLRAIALELQVKEQQEFAERLEGLEAALAQKGNRYG